jgi:hypothetical protein
MATQPKINLIDLNSRMKTEMYSLERRYEPTDTVLHPKTFLKLANAVQGWNTSYPHVIITDIQAIQLTAEEIPTYKMQLLTNSGSFILENNLLVFKKQDQMPHYSTIRKFTFPNL